MNPTVVKDEVTEKNSQIRVPYTALNNVREYIETYLTRVYLTNKFESFDSIKSLSNKGVISEMSSYLYFNVNYITQKIIPRIGTVYSGKVINVNSHGIFVDVSFKIFVLSKVHGLSLDDQVNVKIMSINKKMSCIGVIV
ncbi:MAG: hypothetical protein JKX76_01795 [Colwellia sp.]|nr:hypothetical protein [Colwellia sp.]